MENLEDAYPPEITNTAKKNITLLNGKYFDNRGVDEREYRKPLILWMFSRLGKDSHSFLDGSLKSSTVKTEIYLSNINEFLKNNMDCSFNEESMNEETKVRILLQKLSMLQFNTINGENNAHSDALNIDVLKKYHSVFFVINHDNFRFSHPTIQEYFLAEFILSVFINMSQKMENFKNKVYLSLCEIGVETIDFLFDLTRLLIMKTGDGENPFMIPFLKSYLFDNSEYLYREKISKNPNMFRNGLALVAKKIIKNRRPILFDKDLSRDIIEEYKMEYFVLGRKISDYCHVKRQRSDKADAVLFVRFQM